MSPTTAITTTRSPTSRPQPVPGARGDTLTFTAPTGTTLDAGTTYAVVFTMTGNAVRLDSTTSSDEDSGAFAGWSIADGGYLYNSSNTWAAHPTGEAIRIAIKGTTGPVVWEATLAAPTAWTNLGNTYEGYGSSASSIISTTRGTLTPDSFTVGSTTHTVEMLAYQTGRTQQSDAQLVFFTDTGVTKADLDGLELRITVAGVAKTLAVSSATNFSSGGTNYGIYWEGSIHGYQADDWANKTITIQLRTPNNSATGAPTITGTAQVGETLTAATSGIMDSDGLTSPGSTEGRRVGGLLKKEKGAPLNLG